MSGPRHRGRRRSDLTAEINVTSLVDVAFTLLIIFIITAPIMQGGIEVDLPRAEAAPLTASDVIVVTIDGDGAIFVDDVPVGSMEEFRLVYPRIAQEKGASSAAVKADLQIHYGLVAQVLGAMSAMDVATAGLIVEPDPGS